MTDSVHDGGTETLPPENRPRLIADIGDRLGPYEIVARLGEGGMGRVYRARDPRLGREVALKVVSPALVGDPESMRRFEREARAAAALNHPNVLAIHDVGTAGSVPYLVTELLDGQSLRDVLAQGDLQLDRALALARQVLAGLCAAHDKGIVHRDLKPANLFVGGDGVVKILDFGLARPLVPTPDITAGEPPTLTELTGPGSVVGTAGYMAPEQVRGEQADRRVDVFAFGCVLYEMVTGRRAFRRDTTIESMSAVLRDEPACPSSINPAIDGALDGVIERCLAKDREDRFASAREVMAALDNATIAAGNRESGTSEIDRRRHRRRLRTAAAALVLAVVVFAAVVVLRPRVDRSASPSPPPQAWEQITFFADAAVSPAVSRDGRLLTFLRGASTFFGPAEVYVKILPDGDPVPLTRDGQRKMSPVFSPDGSRIAYTQRDAAGAWDSWVVPVLGGTARPLLLNASGLTWITPQEILFSEINDGIHMGLVTARENRADERGIYWPPDPRGMAHRSARSPDGRWVLAAEMETGEWLPCRMLPFDGSSPGRRVGPDGQCTHAEWSPDGKWMYFSSNANGRFQLWRQRFPDGEPAAITTGPLEVEGLAVTPDGQFALTSIGARQSSVSIVDGDQERSIAGEGFVFLDANSHFGFSRPFSPNGERLFYQRRRAASRATPAGGEYTGELWATDLRTGGEESVLPGIEVYGYDIAADGSQLVAGSIAAEGRPEIWLVPLDRRSPPHRLEVGEAWSPWFGPTGEIFMRRRGPGSEDLVFVWSAGIDEMLPVLETPVLELVGVSPDGQWLVVLLPVTEGKAFGQLAAIPRSGGSPRPICANCFVNWVPGGRYLYVFWYGADHRGMEDVRTILFDLADGPSLPPFPPGGVEHHHELTKLPGVVWTKDGRIYPGPRIDLYAYSRETVQRNIFRVPLGSG